MKILSCVNCVKNCKQYIGNKFLQRFRKVTQFSQFLICKNQYLVSIGFIGVFSKKTHDLCEKYITQFSQHWIKTT